MAYGALTDIRFFQIPNWIPITATLVFLPAAVARDWSMATILGHFGTGTVVLAAGVVLVAYRVFGGGDAKLLAAAAVWMGWEKLLVFLLAVTLAGGILALVLMVFRRLPLPPSLVAIEWVRRLHGEEPGIPYGIAIAAVAILLYPSLPIANAAG